MYPRPIHNRTTDERNPTTAAPDTMRNITKRVEFGFSPEASWAIRFCRDSTADFFKALAMELRAIRADSGEAVNSASISAGMPGDGCAFSERRLCVPDLVDCGSQRDQPFVCADTRLLRSTALFSQWAGRQVRHKT